MSSPTTSQAAVSIFPSFTPKFDELAREVAAEAFNVAGFRQVADGLQHSADALGTFPGQLQPHMNALHGAMVGRTADAISTQLTHGVEQLSDVHNRVTGSNVTALLRDLANTIEQHNLEIQAKSKWLELFGIPLFPLHHWDDDLVAWATPLVDEIKRRYGYLAEAIGPLTNIAWQDPH